MDVSVVIPVRNGAATIARQLGALGSQEFDGDWEVVIADNGSTDDTVAVVEAHRHLFPHLRIVSETSAAGINVARNAGVAAASGRHVLLCDSDDVVSDGWLTAMDRGLVDHDLVGGPVEEISLNRADVAAFSDRRTMTENPTVPGFLSYPIGCNCGFRREVWQAVDGFDDGWARGSTEIEFFWRAQLVEGASLGFVPDAPVAYQLADSLAAQRRKYLVSASSQARLYATFRRDGMPRSSVASAARAWLWLGYRLPWRVGRDTERRRKWEKVYLWRAGKLRGSLRWRVLYL